MTEAEAHAWIPIGKAARAQGIGNVRAFLIIRPLKSYHCTGDRRRWRAFGRQQSQRGRDKADAPDLASSLALYSGMKQ
jgi:hypothetical protein